MALSIIAQPAAIALTRNPVGIRLQTDNYLTTAGVKYQKVFEVTGACTANQTIIFAWNGKTVTLTCKASPDNAGNQFKDNAAADPLNTWFNTYVIPAWRSNYDLNEDFNIVVIDSGVSSCHFYIQARNTGAAYNLTITNSLSNFAYIDPYGGHSAVTGVTEVTRSNFKIYCDVYLEDTWNSGTFSRIITLQGLPDDSLQADFQIQNALRAYLTADVPSFSQATITQCATILKKYYFTYAEAFGDPIAVQKVYNGEHTSLLALYAGLLSSAFPGNTFIADYTTAASGRKFLTTQPPEKTVSEDQQEYLYLYNEQTSGTLTLKLKVYFTDGTTSASDVLSKTSLVNQVYIFPAGYTQLGIGAINAAKTVDYWELHVSHSGGNTSETFTYNRYRYNSSNNRYFLYLSSLGSMDTLWCRGDFEESLIPESIEAERFLPFDYALSDGAQYFDVNISHRASTEINTGFMPKENLLALQDFIISPLIYEIGDSDFIPVQLYRKEVKLFRTDDTRYALTFKILSAYTNEAYSS